MVPFQSYSDFTFSLCLGRSWYGGFGASNTHVKYAWDVGSWKSLWDLSLIWSFCFSSLSYGPSVLCVKNHKIVLDHTHVSQGLPRPRPAMGPSCPAGWLSIGVQNASSGMVFRVWQTKASPSLSSKARHWSYCEVMSYESDLSLIRIHMNWLRIACSGKWSWL